MLMLAFSVFLLFTENKI